jgi:FkbM family methyltransferase
MFADDTRRVAATQMPTQMISYAQNFEDVMLRRVLCQVRRGYYIDVGAQDATIDSVTRWFYDCGWSGINIDPHPDYYAQLVLERPRDINLNVAVSDTAGEAQFCFVRNSGLSSLDMSAATVAARHGLRSHVGMVTLSTLDAVLAAHPLPEIHFLKIDVEGAEAKVLTGIDLKKHRPWVILVEATEPTKTDTTWHQFESLITERGYRCVYFDGLNTWYLRNESLELAEHFRLPPNVFDAFVRWREHAWNQRTPGPAPVTGQPAARAQGFKGLFGK